MNNIMNCGVKDIMYDNEINPIVTGLKYYVNTQDVTQSHSKQKLRKTQIKQ